MKYSSKTMIVNLNEFIKSNWKDPTRIMKTNYIKIVDWLLLMMYVAEDLR